MINPTRGDISRSLIDAITAGRYPVGGLLPTEFELCSQYGASRYSVRRALQELQDLGLISRRKHVGTRVESVRPTPGFTQSIATVDELAQFGAEHVRTVMSVETVVVDAELAGLLGCPPGQRRLRVSSLRREAGPHSRPLGWTDVYVEPAYAGVAEQVRRSPELLISSLIESHYGKRIARIAQDIQATSLPAALAEPLRAEAGSPALRIVRRYLDDRDQAFEISVSVHPADRFTVSSVLTRSRDRAG